MSVSLQPQGGTVKRDAGNYRVYAGPVTVTVTVKAAGTCVRSGGSIGSVSWVSGYGHCD